MWIHHLNYKRTGVKLITIEMITTPTPWRLVVQFGFQISPTCDANKRNRCLRTPISPTRHTLNSPSYQCGVRVEACFSLHWNLIDSSQSTNTDKTLCNEVVVRQFASATNGILAGDDAELDAMETKNDLEMTRDAEEWNLHWMAKVLDILEMWQDTQILRAKQKECHIQNKQMTAVG